MPASKEAITCTLEKSELELTPISNFVWETSETLSQKLLDTFWSEPHRKNCSSSWTSKLTKTHNWVSPWVSLRQSLREESHFPTFWRPFKMLSRYCRETQTLLTLLWETTNLRERLPRKWAEEKAGKAGQTQTWTSRTKTRWTSREWCSKTKWTSRDPTRTWETPTWTRWTSRECSSNLRCRDLRPGSPTSRLRATRTTLRDPWTSKPTLSSNSNSSKEHPTRATCSETLSGKTDWDHFNYSIGLNGFIRNVWRGCIRW